ncbi:hypothetical protein GJW-30_1_00171 [Variibacter gotjawalensis]|uniref:DUF1573 domain-containing protein n=1 Tax=Variibacter gotjawalensis TaxID=1333996 RepID=A0A0S3PP65_9BRAD|nr:hypothetical protein [Variibacter gotjawalensis]NIK47958.1 hypothetical protein [Variibacter gotjawalensis]RZS49835.1 hypothetical protein EV661_2280 [Variibacter gotjawalensis]BAT57664.1 hypothetical protein GJW-30_1_00171 [Variibacter gotjawalensis]
MARIKRAMTASALLVIAAPAIAQAPTKLHGAPPEVSFVSETGNCATMARVDHVKPARGAVEVRLSAIDAKADATCVCKLPGPKVLLSRTTKLGTQEPQTRELSMRLLERDKPATFQLKLTIAPGKGSESYLLRAVCNG